MTIYHASKAAEKTEYGLVFHAVYSSESNRKLIGTIVYNKHITLTGKYTAYNNAAEPVALGTAHDSIEALALYANPLYANRVAAE